MLALFGAKFVAVVSTRGQPVKSCYRTVAVATVAGLLSAGLPATVSLAGKDPANPTARVPGVRYRATIAPYTKLRPSTPRLWQERNESAAPKAKQDH